MFLNNYIYKLLYSKFPPPCGREKRGFRRKCGIFDRGPRRNPGAGGNGKTYPAKELRTGKETKERIPKTWYLYVPGYHLRDSTHVSYTKLALLATNPFRE